jgi:hypothetical protein
MPWCPACEVRSTDPACWSCGQPYPTGEAAYPLTAARADTSWLAMASAMRAAYASADDADHEDDFLGWVGL